MDFIKQIYNEIRYHPVLTCESFPPPTENNIYQVESKPQPLKLFVPESDGFDHYKGARLYNLPFIWAFKTFNEVQERLNEYYYPSDRIPRGIYCYTYDENGKAYYCPYLEHVDGYHHQENGYCKKINVKDWEEKYLSLLWDMCKECGIKVDGADRYDSVRQELVQIDEYTGEDLEIRQQVADLLDV